MAVNSLPGWTLGGFLPLTLSRELASEISFETNFQTEDEKWMFVALLEGMKGCGISNPNPSVGCIIVKEGKQISSGATEAYKHKHAERVALEKIPSGTNLGNATAYVSLEPCSHQGHQPPCVDLLIEKKVGRVVVATNDPNPKVGGAGIQKLKASGIKVEVGTLKREASLWHFPFLASQHLKRPVLIGKWAQSSNGLLAGDDGKPVAISGPASRAYGHWLRQKYDAVCVGAGTYLRDKPALTVRDCRTPILRQPIKIIIDPRGRLSKTVFPKEEKIVLLPNVSALQQWTTSEEATQILGKPLQSVYIEGGPTLLKMLLDQQALDALHVFTAGKPLGGTKYGLPFQKYESGFKKLTELIVQEDLLKEYVLNTHVSDII